MRINTQIIKPNQQYQRANPRGKLVIIDKEKEKKRAIRDAFIKSNFKKRFTYDEHVKEVKGSRMDIPNQQDFLRMKIDERKQVFNEVVQQCKYDLQTKLFEELNEEKTTGYKDSIVKRVQNQQYKDLEVYLTNGSLFQETIDRNRKLKEEKELEQELIVKNKKEQVADPKQHFNPRSAHFS